VQWALCVNIPTDARTVAFLAIFQVPCLHVLLVDPPHSLTLNSSKHGPHNCILLFVCGLPKDARHHSYSCECSLCALCQPAATSTGCKPMHLLAPVDLQQQQQHHIMR
jgi:hypothetical protein